MKNQKRWNSIGVFLIVSSIASQSHAQCPPDKITVNANGNITAVYCTEYSNTTDLSGIVSWFYQRMYDMPNAPTNPTEEQAPKFTINDTAAGGTSLGMTCSGQAESCSMMESDINGHATRLLVTNVNAKRAIPDRSMVDFSRQISNKVYENALGASVSAAFAGVSSLAVLGLTQGTAAAAIARADIVSRLLPTLGAIPTLGKVPMYVQNVLFNMDTEKVARRMGMIFEMAAPSPFGTCSPSACIGGMTGINKGYQTAIGVVRGTTVWGEKESHAMVLMKHPTLNYWAALSEDIVTYGNDPLEAMLRNIDGTYSSVTSWSRTTVGEYMAQARNQDWKFIEYMMKD